MVNETSNARYPIEESMVIREGEGSVTYKHNTGKLFTVRRPSPLTSGETSPAGKQTSPTVNNAMRLQREASRVVNPQDSLPYSLED